MKNSKTKKRVGVIAMALVLLLAVGAAAGTTLAKYISSATMKSQIATVAKWGYTMTVDADDMFGDAYGNVDHEKNFATVATSGDAGIVVKADTEGKTIVAPGTKGEMTLQFNGQAEVNAVLKLNITDFMTIVLADNGGANGFAYYPIKWTVGSQTISTNLLSSDVKTSDDTYKNALIAALANAIQTELTNKVAGGDVIVDTATNAVYLYIPANTAVSALNLKFAWEWEFERESETNNEDTLLGLFAYNNAMQYGELPENVLAWLANNDNSKYENDTTVIEKKGLLTTAESTLESKKSALDEAKSALEQADPEDNSAEQTAYEQAEEAYNGALTAKNSAQAAYDEAVLNAIKAFYSKLQTASELQIRLNFAASFEQTQQTLAEFQTAHGKVQP